MNKAIQFLNKSIFLSICVHLIGVTIASLSIVGGPDKYGDTIVAEFVSLPKTKPGTHTSSAQDARINAAGYASFTAATYPADCKNHARLTNELQFAVDTLPVSVVHQTTSTEISTESENALQYRLSSRPMDRGSQPTNFAP